MTPAPRFRAMLRTEPASSPSASAILIATAAISLRLCVGAGPRAGFSGRVQMIDGTSRTTASIRGPAIAYGARGYYCQTAYTVPGKETTMEEAIVWTRGLRKQ